MASNAVLLPKSGTNPDEYKKVQTNLNSIVESLESNKAARNSLHRAFKEKSWIKATDQSSPDKWILVVLDRIRVNVGEYYEFMEMLGNIVGLDHIKTAIDETSFPVEETHQFSRENSNTSDKYAVAHDNGYIEKRTHSKPGGAPQRSLPKGKKTVIDLPSDNTDSGLDSDVETKSVVKRKFKKSALKQGVSSPLTQSRSLAPASDPDFKEFTQQDGEANEPPTTTLVPPSTQSLVALDDDATSPGVLVTGNEADHQQEEILAEKRRLEDELSAKERELKLREQEIAGLNKKMKAYESTIKQHETEKESLCQDNKKLQEKLDEIHTKYEEAKVAKEKAELKHDSLVVEVGTLKNTVSELNQKVELLREEHRKSEEERRKSDAKVELLQKTCDEHRKAEEERRISDVHYKAKVDEKLCTLEEDHSKREEKDGKRHQELVNLIKGLELDKKQ